MAKLAILLASYGGSEFLDAQLWSIRRQSFQDWRLLVRNDGEDPFSERIVRMHMRADRRIAWIEDHHERLGVCGNFERLLNLAHRGGADYFALADQDDVWVENKLETMVSLAHATEQSAGKTPIAIHSDLTVTDAALRPIHPSFVRLRNLDPNPGIIDLLAQNVVTGCTLLGNAALLDLALPFPAGVAIHDWWLAVCARTGGRLIYLDKPTVLYRQHGQNSIGAQLSLIHIRAIARRNRLAFDTSFVQAGALLQRLSPSAPQRELLGRYLALPTLPYALRWREMYRIGLRRRGLLGRIVYVLRLMSA